MFQRAFTAFRTLLEYRVLWWCNSLLLLFTIISRLKHSLVTMRWSNFSSPSFCKFQLVLMPLDKRPYIAERNGKHTLICSSKDLPLPHKSTCASPKFCSATPLTLLHGCLFTKLNMCTLPQHARTCFFAKDLPSHSSKLHHIKSTQASKGF